MNVIRLFQGCRRHRAAISLLSVGCLPAEQEAATRAHLTECAACETRFEELRVLAGQAARLREQLPEAVPSPALRERWTARITEAPGEPSHEPRSSGHQSAHSILSLRGRGLRIHRSPVRRPRRRARSDAPYLPPGFMAGEHGAGANVASHEPDSSGRESAHSFLPNEIRADSRPLLRFITGAQRPLEHAASQNPPCGAAGWLRGPRLAWGTLAGIWALTLLFRFSAPETARPAVSSVPWTWHKVLLVLHPDSDNTRASAPGSSPRLQLETPSPLPLPRSDRRWLETVNPTQHA